MRASGAIAALLAALALAAFAVAGAAMWRALQGGGAVGAHMSIAFVVVLAVAAATFGLFHVKLLRPLAALTGDLLMHAQTRIDRTLAIVPGHWLDGLSAAIEKLLGALRAARGETEKAVNAATQRAEEQKSGLETILLDLSEGVIVCNLEHRILLYNQAAARILDMRDALGLDRSLFGRLTREPVVYALEMLLEQAAANGDATAHEREPNPEVRPAASCAARSISALSCRRG